jgi:hypothetical protein
MTTQTQRSRDIPATHVRRERDRKPPEMPSRSGPFPDGALQGAGLFEGVQQCVCSFQVGCVEPFREPVIDMPKQGFRVGGAALIP